MWSLQSADTRGADNAGGQTADRPVQEERQDRRARGLHRQPAGPSHRRAALHPACPQCRQARVRRRFMTNETHLQALITFYVCNWFHAGLRRMTVLGHYALL